MGKGISSAWEHLIKSDGANIKTRTGGGRFAKKGIKMRWITTGLAMLILAGAAYGQNASPQDLQKLNAELKAELTAAQQRKSELSTRVDELEKQNKAQAGQIDALQKQAAGFADRTLFLGAHYAAWEQFIAANPAIRSQWDLFEAMTGLGNTEQNPVFVDRDWPLSGKE